jgi:hypothetical protein
VEQGEIDQLGKLGTHGNFHRVGGFDLLYRRGLGG